MSTRRGAVALALLALVAPAAHAQRDTVVVAGPQYAKSSFYRFLYGSHYRELWTTPVRARVLNLRRYAGGLRPTEEGGGMQTASLRFKGGDGYEYRFRSTDKTPDLLPDVLDHTFLQDIVVDQTRAQHPGGWGIAAELLDAAEVAHTTPILVVLPDSPDLGEFREKFGGRLGYLERRATMEDGRPGIPGARDLKDSEDFLPLRFRSPDNQVDAPAMVAARLMDLLMGDWDRHRGQWRWARMTDRRPHVWLPVPEDRDHAFVRFDGLIPRLARSISAPQLVEFGREFSELRGMAWNGRDLDRWLLSPVDRMAWDSIALELQARLTDSVIDAAVATMPDSWRELSGPRISAALRSRRNLLPAEARRFYLLLAREAEVHLTAADEDVTVERQAGGVVLVRAAARGEPDYFARRYLPDETQEIRLYLRGGADRVLVRGDGPGDIMVRIIGDTVQIADSTRVGSLARYPTHWDEPRESLRPEAPDSMRGHRAGDDSKIEPPPRRDWGNSNGPTAWLGIGPDVGVFIGGGIERKRYGFRRLPWATLWTLRAGWSTEAHKGRVSLTGTVRRTQSRVRTEMGVLASGIEVMRWHGLGNETGADSSSDYYRIRRGEVAAGVQVVRPLGEHSEWGIGPIIRYSHTHDRDVGIIADSLPYGSGNHGMAGLRAELTWDRRDEPNRPTRGLLLTAGASAYPAVLNLESAFGELHAQASTYVNAPRLPLRPTLAFRAGAKTVFGHYPFAEAAYIGDPSTVRLGRRNRYGGDVAIWGGTELRLAMGRFKVLLPGEWGIFGLADVGRVFLSGEQSAQWHPAFGGGMWLSMVQPKNLVSITVAGSRERTAVYVGAGFAY